MRIHEILAIGLLTASCADTGAAMTEASSGDSGGEQPMTGPGGPTTETPTTGTPTTEISTSEPLPGTSGTTGDDTGQVTADPSMGTTPPVTTDDPETTGPAPTCDDGAKNGDETGVDCGGSCPACGPGPQPDLNLDYFYVDEHFLEPGEFTKMHFQINNDGAVDTEYQFQIRTVLTKNEVVGDDDDVIIFEWQFPYIVEAEGHSLWKTSVEIPPEAYDGGYNVAMALDITDIIAESNETNNTRLDPDSLTIWNNPKPATVDFAPSAVLAGEHQVLQGLETTYGFDVENLGPGPAGAYSVGLYYSKDTKITAGDTLICKYDDLDGLAAMTKESQQAKCAVPALTGNYYFGVVVDPANATDEIDEANNAGADAGVVAITAPNVDLKLGAVTSSKYAVDVQEQVTLTATVTNAGADPAPVFGVSFYLSSDAQITAADKLICSPNSAGPLAPGAQVDVASPCAIPGVTSGVYFLGAIADQPNKIVEVNETNNTGTAVGKLTVTAPDVDLQYELHWDDAINPGPGDMVKYHLQIRNNGNAASPAKFAISLHYSADKNITPLDASACAVDVGPVPAKTITEFQFNCLVPDVPPAFYYSGVIIDPGNQVPETNEGNNIGVSVNPQQIQ